MKVSTQPFNSIQKIKNIINKKGRTANLFANGLKNEGYKTIYQRPWNGDSVVISGKNVNGDTKTFILSYAGYKVKTNTLTSLPNNTMIREIDKAHFNQHDAEISGVNKIQKLVNGHICDSKVKKRGLE